MNSVSSTQKLSNAGVSIWLDDLSRNRIESGNLAELINLHNVVGVTTNPAIFARTMTSDSSYDAAISACRSEGLTAGETVTRLATEDVRAACDELHDVYVQSAGVDGRVSIEVEPEFAHDTERTIQRASELAQLVGRPNVMIKIPATDAGLPAISQVLAQGISVNVTLVFSISRYREVVNAYLTGLELARKDGHDLSQIHSVASFFISRLDTVVDPILRENDNPDAVQLQGQAGIANACVAYEAFEQLFTSERARFLMKHGATSQRLLWASTGAKDPALADTHYVEGLIAPMVVNTMPEETLRAVIQQGVNTTGAISGKYAWASTTLNELERFGLEYQEITQQLETEGLQKFADSWNGLIDSVNSRLKEDE